MVSVLDLKGLRCPMPLLRLKRQMAAMEPGDQLEVITTDAGSARDFPVYLRQINSRLLSLEERMDEFHFIIEK